MGAHAQGLRSCLVYCCSTFQQPPTSSSSVLARQRDHIPRQLVPMASIAAVYRVSARAATQQLRNNGARRGALSDSGFMDRRLIAMQLSTRPRPRSQRKTSTCRRYLRR
jgi:carbamoylphosphate synthase small subunit